MTEFHVRRRLPEMALSGARRKRLAAN